MPHALHSTTFKWNPKEAVLPIYRSLVEEKSKAAPAVTKTGAGATNSISLIAGAYGESSEEEEEEPSPEKPGTPHLLLTFKDVV